MMQPGSPQALMPPDESTLMRRVQDLERQVRELVAHNVLAAAGVRTEPGRFIIDGDLEVPNGKIKNEWLESPVVPGADWAETSGFSLSNAWELRTACSITVPAGYTVMHFDAIATVLARNDVGSTQYLMARIYRQINAGGYVYASTTDQQTLPNGYWGTAMVPYKWSEAVTPGQVHEFSIWTWVGGSTWSAHASHHARIEVSALFTR